MKEKKICLEVDEVSADLVLRRATVGDDMRRGMLAAKAMQNPLSDPAEQTVAMVIYPRCLACVSGTVSGRPVSELTAAEFIALPHEIGEAWFEAALDLNPSWNLDPQTVEQREGAKKK